MRVAALALTLTAALAAAPADAQPKGRSATSVTHLCPQIGRAPVTSLRQLPAGIRKALGHMADVDGRWNVGDAIGPGDERYPFRHFMAGGDMGGGRWLVIWEQGGFARFENVEVYRLTRRRSGMTVDKVISEKGGDLPGLCRRAAAQLRK